MFPVSEFASRVDAPDHQGGHQISENKDTGPEAAVKGVVEDVKGKVKEAAGAVTDGRRAGASGPPPEGRRTLLAAQPRSDVRLGRPPQSPLSGVKGEA